MLFTFLFSYHPCLFPEELFLRSSRCLSTATSVYSNQIQIVQLKENSEQIGEIILGSLPQQ
uniref:Uncharacterized protein n=1 Tax=Arion vulgaris TaxID=1028688 RepID=A0A0B7BUW0_9EUPU